MENSKIIVFFCLHLFLIKASARLTEVFIMQMVQAHTPGRTGKIRRREKSGNEEFQERCDEQRSRGERKERRRGGRGRGR